MLGLVVELWLGLGVEVGLVILYGTVRHCMVYFIALSGTVCDGKWTMDNGMMSGHDVCTSFCVPQVPLKYPVV